MIRTQINSYMHSEKQWDIRINPLVNHRLLSLSPLLCCQEKSGNRTHWCLDGIMGCPRVEWASLYLKTPPSTPCQLSCSGRQRAIWKYWSKPCCNASPCLSDCLEKIMSGDRSWMCLWIEQAQGPVGTCLLGLVANPLLPTQAFPNTWLPTLISPHGWRKAGYKFTNYLLTLHWAVP